MNHHVEPATIPLTADDIRSLVRPDHVHRRAYADPAVFELEQERIFSRLWIYVAQAVFNFSFANRNRRPPTDPVNAMLSLAYSMLTKDCTLAVLAVGFDPYIGFYHQPRFGRPALGLDLMEEFRPLIAESIVLSCINNRVVTDKDFVRAGQAVNLTAPGRKRF